MTDDLPRIRCAAMWRTEQGFMMCHLDQHPPDMPHHVRDRSWYTDGRPAPRLQLGVPCGEACGWPDYIVAYLGPAPRAETGGPRTPRRR
jgi:hypothetical protein